MLTVGDMEQARYSGDDPRRPNYETANKYPTPTAQMAKHAEPTKYEIENKKEKAGHLHIVVGGQLNPDWVEWLMGWPIGWTSTEPMGKEVFGQWLNKQRAIN